MSAQPAPQLALVAPQQRWLSTQQVLERTGWTDRWLREQARLGAVISRETSQTAANGRRLREYLAASLPGEAPLESEPVRAIVPAHGPLFAGISLSTARVALPDPEAQQQAEQRFTILQPVFDYAADGERLAQLRLRDGRAVTSKSRLILYLAETRSVSERTLKMWLQRYRDGGFPALADKQRSDKNTSRFFAEHIKAAYLAAYVYLELQQSCRVAHEAICEDRELLGISEADLPSYETVRAWLKAMPPCLKAYAREGRAQYQTRMSPYLSRGYTEPANSIWVSDHMIHDVEVMNDCFDEQPFGEPIRLRFTCLLDYRSRFVLGYSWCWEGSSRSIASALRRAIEVHGAPAHFYCDNGKDYLKVAKGARPGYLGAAGEDWALAEMQQIEDLGIMARLGISVTHCIVRHPQSKHVERFFRTLHERFDKRWQTYTAGAPHLRPDKTSAAMMLHRRALKHDQLHRSHHPLASEFIMATLRWIDEYHHTPHEGKGMDGRTPAEVFAQERDPNQAARPTVEPEHLAMLLQEHTRRLVRECAVTVGKRRYVAFDGDSSSKLHLLNETEVVVACDPHDAEKVAILDEGGHLITWARAEDLLRWAPDDKETRQQISAGIAEARRLEKATRGSLAEIARTARANGARDRVEVLLDRPQLTAGGVSELLTQRKPRAPRPDDQAHAPASAAEIAANVLEALK